MSVLIGRLIGPNHNTAEVTDDHDNVDRVEFNHVAEVWASVGGVELPRLDIQEMYRRGIALDPIVARNFAALLVRAADEVERMRANQNSGRPHPSRAEDRIA